MTTCPKCRRHVRRDHAECKGDPRGTCAIYGCGLKGAHRRLVEPYNNAPPIWLWYCEEHS